MGFADRNSLAGKTSEVAFPDAIKRGASAVATPFSVQITDSNGSPNDPDNALVFVRITNAAGTALDSLLYTDSGLSSAATNSSNATYGNGSSAYWKQVSTSGGKISLYHKTAGGDSSVEGLYNVEIAWFENGTAVARANAFRIVDAADLDTMSANIDSVLVDTGTTLPSTLSSIASAVGNIPTTAQRGTDSASLASVVGALDDAAIGAAAGDNDTAMSMIKGVITDTNELQTDWTNGGRLDTIVDSILADTATIGAPVGASISADIAAVKADTTAILVDTSTTLDDFIDTEAAAILADTNELQGDWTNGGRLDVILDAVLADTTVIGAAVGASISADIAAVKTVVDTVLVDTSTTLDNFIDTEVAAILADTATLGAPAGASHAADIAAIKVDTAATLVDTATLGSPAGASHAADIAAIKADTAAALADTNELQTDWVNGGRLDLLLDGVKSVTDALPNSGALTDLATASALTTLQTAVTSIQNNTRFVATVPGKLNRESAAVVVGCYLYDTDGNMEDPDSNGLYVKISQMDGTAIASRYYADSGLSSAISAEGSGTFSGYYALSRVAAGKYAFFYKNDAAHTEENLIVEFGWEEGSSARYQSRAMQVSDAADLDDIVADTNELQGDWTNGGRLDLLLDAALADTNELQGDWANGGRLDLLLDAIPTTAMRGTDSAALASVAGALTDGAVGAVSTTDTMMGYVKGILTDTGTTIPASFASSATSMAAIVADTNELQTDWVNGGRLDLILDAVLADTTVIGAAVGASISADIAAVKTVVDAVLTDTGTTLDDLIDTEVAAIVTATAAILADTVTLGTPVGSDFSADIAAVKAVVDSILTDTGTTLDNLIDTEVAAILADSNELQTDWANGGRLDLLLDKAAQTVHHATMKRYLKNDTTVMSSDPSDDAVACSSTTQSTTYVVLDVLAVDLDEGSDATFTDVFSVLKWLHQGTNGGGGGAVTTKWMISPSSETPGSAPSGDAVTVTGEVTGNTSANTSSMSGLLTTTAIAALASAANGQLRFLLCGKVADARDTCTGRVYKSSSAEVSYKV